MPRSTDSKFDFKKFILLAPTLSMIGCATGSTHGELAQYYESSFNDRNRAPASLSPQMTESGQPKLDSTYLRTQADYNFSLGESLSYEGNHQRAIEAFKSTLIYDNDSPTVRLRLATEYMRSGLLSEAVEQAQLVVKNHPERIDAMLLLGGLYTSMHLYPKAIEQYEAILKKNKNHPEATLYLGAVYTEVDKPEKAIVQFKALTKNPDYETPHVAYYYIGRVYSEMKKKDSNKLAEEAFKKSLSLKNDFVDSALALGNLYRKSGDEKKVIQYFSSYQKEFVPNVKMAEYLVQHYIENKKYDEAYEQLEFLEQNVEDTLTVKMKMALILIDKRMYDLAIKKLEVVLVEAPESDKIRFYLAAVYEETKQPEKAILNYKKIPPHSQYFAESVVHMAYLQKVSGQLEVAIRTLENSMKPDADQPQFVAMYASLLDEKGETKKAADVLTAGVSKYPENVQLRFYHGSMQDKIGNKAVTISEMQKVIELDPDHVQGLNYLAFTWAEKKENLPEAEKLVRRALTLSAGDAYIMDTLGWVLYQQGKYEEAIRVLESAFKIHPNASVIAEHLGDAYLKKSMIDKAKGMYDKAAKLEADASKVEQIKKKVTSIESQNYFENRTPASNP